MVKYLFVQSYLEPDYGATLFESHQTLTIDDVVNEMEKLGVSELSVDIFNFTLLKFDEVDPNFESFMRSELCDYDQLKAKDIYRVG